MAIVPVLHCQSISAAVVFYTAVLDFEIVSGDERVEDPAYRVLARRDDYLILSSHLGDSRPGQAIVVTSTDVDADWQRFRARGLVSLKSATESPVHAGPVEQTRGHTRVLRR